MPVSEADSYDVYLKTFYLVSLLQSTLVQSRLQKYLKESLCV